MTPMTALVTMSGRILQSALTTHESPSHADISSILDNDAQFIITTLLSLPELLGAHSKWEKIERTSTAALLLYVHLVCYGWRCMSSTSSLRSLKYPKSWLLLLARAIPNTGAVAICAMRILDDSESPVAISFVLCLSSILALALPFVCWMVPSRSRGFDLENDTESPSGDQGTRKN